MSDNEFDKRQEDACAFVAPLFTCNYRSLLPALKCKSEIRSAFKAPDGLVEAIEKLRDERPMTLEVRAHGTGATTTTTKTVSQLLCHRFPTDLASLIGNILCCKRHANDSSYAYYQLNAIEIERCFEIAKCQGTLFHLVLEHKLQVRFRVPRRRVAGDNDSLDKFIDILEHEQGLTLLQTETPFVCPTYEPTLAFAVVGRIDAIFVVKAEFDQWKEENCLPNLFPSLHLFDWKLSSTTLLSDKPVDDKYALQMAIYKTMLCKMGYRIARATVCRFAVDEQSRLPHFVESLDVCDNIDLDNAVQTLLASV